MKLKTLSVFAILFATLVFSSCVKDEKSSSSNKTDIDKLEKREDLVSNGSYAIAFDIANNMINAGLNINRDYFIKGLSDAFDKKAGMLTPEERMKYSQMFADSMKSQDVAKVEKELEKVRELEAKLPPLQKDFFATNKKKRKVIETPSGIQIEIIKEGTGKKVEPDDLYFANLEASYVDGTVFENSKNQNQGKPITIPGQGVLKGWKEAMSHAKEGGIYRFYFPPEQAFGNEGVFPTIPPNVIVIYEVELVKFASKFDPSKVPQRPQSQGAPQQFMPMPPPGAMPMQGMPGKR